MTKRQSLRYLRIYLLYVVGAALFFYLAGLAILFFIDTPFTRAALHYALWVYMYGLVFLFPLVWSAFFSFSLMLFGIRQPMPLFKRVVELFPAFIWDELKDPERGK